MKKILDKFEIKKQINKNLTETKLDFIQRVSNSKNVTKSSNKGKSIIKIESTELEKWMVPNLPKYKATVEFIEIGLNESEVRATIKGNSIIYFFKYMVIFIFIISELAYFLLEAKLEFEFILIPFTMIFHFFLLNFWNRSHIKNGTFEISQLIV